MADKNIRENKEGRKRNRPKRAFAENSPWSRRAWRAIEDAGMTVFPVERLNKWRGEMTANPMPAKIWACIDQYTEEGWFEADGERKNPHETDTLYVRADIADDLLKALKAVRIALVRDSFSRVMTDDGEWLGAQR